MERGEHGKRRVFLSFAGGNIYRDEEIVIIEIVKQCCTLQQKAMMS
jgi:hypothetical protein